MVANKNYRQEQAGRFSCEVLLFACDCSHHDRYEDERLAEGRFAAFTDKKERKLLASDHRRKKMVTCLQKVSRKGAG